MTISLLNRNTVLAAILMSCVSIPLAIAESGERDGRRGGPPQEALDACVEKLEGDACSFSGRRGDEEGACVVPPRDNEMLACKPANNRPRDERPSDPEEG